CPFCIPSIPLDPLKPHSLLAHIGAHILNESDLPSTEPCGLCGSPSPSCQYYLTRSTKGSTRTKIDYHTSRGCRNLAVRFNYSVAKVSKESAPCSNVPIRCPICPPNAFAIWKYNAKYHFINQHPTVQLDRYKDLWNITESEMKAMKEVWKNRTQIPKTRGPKKKKGGLGTLVMSKTHTISLVQRCVLNSIKQH
ncbi:uncharacterized protein EV420DRAFT_1274042, partial [Desarmillaria tabescens]